MGKDKDWWPVGVTKTTDDFEWEDGYIRLWPNPQLYNGFSTCQPVAHGAMKVRNDGNRMYIYAYATERGSSIHAQNMATYAVATLPAETAWIIITVAASDKSKVKLTRIE